MTNISQRSKVIVAQRQMQQAIADLNELRDTVSTALKSTIETVYAGASDVPTSGVQQAFDKLQEAIVDVAAQLMPENVPAEAELTNLWSAKKHRGYSVCVRMPDHWHSSLGYRDGRNPVQSDIFQLLRSHAIEPLTLHNGSEAEIQITGNHDNPELVIQLKQEIAALLERHGYPCVILGESSNATCVMPQTVDVTA